MSKLNKLFLTTALIQGICSPILHYAQATDHHEVIEQKASALSSLAQKALKSFNEQKLLPTQITKIQEQICDGQEGSKAELILLIDGIQDNKKVGYVIKGMRDEHEFSREQYLVKHNSIAKYNDILKKFADQENSKTLRLTNYYGTLELQHDNKPFYLTIMEKASGMPLRYFHEKLFSKDNNQFSEEDIIQIGASIGSQLGTAARAFFNENQTYLCHGDWGAQNIFYDNQTGQLWWIDLGGTEEIAFDPQKNRFAWKPWANYFDSELEAFKCHSASTDDGISIKKYNKKGLEAFKQHRLITLYNNALAEEYKRQVYSLIREEEREKSDDHFMKYAEFLRDSYLKDLKEEYSPDDIEKILNYLSSKIASSDIEVKEEVTEESKFMANTNLSDKLVNELLQEMAHNRRYREEDKIYEALRSYNSDYNAYGLQSPRNYIHNFNILNQKPAQLRIMRVLDSVVKLI